MPLPPGTPVGPWVLQTPSGLADASWAWHPDGQVWALAFPVSASGALAHRLKAHLLDGRTRTSSSLVGARDAYPVGDDLVLITDPTEGETLASVLQRLGPRPVGEVMDLARSVIAALSHLHASGRTHGELTSGHVLCTNDPVDGVLRVRLVDLGVSRALEAVGITHAPSNPAYSPPEASPRRRTADDLFALGLVLREALAGRPLFSGSEDPEAKRRQLLRDARETRPDVPAAVAEAILLATHPDPTRRFPDWGAMARALEGAPPPERSPAYAPTVAIRVPLEQQKTVMLRRTPPAVPSEAIPSIPLPLSESTSSRTVDTASWRPGARTMAFIRKQQRPWKFVGWGLATAGALVGASVLIHSALVSRRVGPLFVVEFTNLDPAALQVACSAGDGDAKREWIVAIHPSERASIPIPALPASCDQVKKDGSRATVWSTPGAVSLGGETVVEAEPLLLPPEAPTPTVAVAKKQSARQAPSMSRVYLGSAAPAPAPACADLVALEPVSMTGGLTPEVTACLEGTLASTDLPTQKDRVSRILLWNAEARGDRVEWERLVRRHLEQIDRSDPDICTAYAIFLKQKGDDRSLESAIVWANHALENKERLTGDAFVKRVSALLALRTRAGVSLWQSADRRFVEKRDPVHEQRAEDYRGEAKQYAREWYDYAISANLDPDPARRLCQSVSGTTTFCP